VRLSRPPAGARRSSAGLDVVMANAGVAAQMAIVDGPMWSVWIHKIFAVFKNPAESLQTLRAAGPPAPILRHRGRLRALRVSLARRRRSICRGWIPTALRRQATSKSPRRRRLGPPRLRPSGARVGAVAYFAEMTTDMTRAERFAPAAARTTSPVKGGRAGGPPRFSPLASAIRRDSERGHPHGTASRPRGGRRLGGAAGAGPTACSWQRAVAKGWPAIAGRWGRPFDLGPQGSDPDSHPTQALSRAPHAAVLPRVATGSSRQMKLEWRTVRPAGSRMAFGAMDASRWFFLFWRRPAAPTQGPRLWHRTRG